MKLKLSTLLILILFPVLSNAQNGDDHPFHLYAYSGYGFSIEDDTNTFDFSIHSYFSATYDVNDKFDLGVLAGLDYNVFDRSLDNNLIFENTLDALIFIPVGIEVGYSITDKFRWSVNAGRAFNITEDVAFNDDATFIATNFAFISKYAYGAHVGIKSYSIGDDAQAVIVQLGLTVKFDLFKF